ncbi:hypothetical protein AB0F25_08870 [Streptomyces wedmorensis]|uniref:hypothetical protein n=1 Tax=Streptomyces wedmorensis TaxID=43759 RepID=UPI0034400773
MRITAHGGPTRQIFRLRAVTGATRASDVADPGGRLTRTFPDSGDRHPTAGDPRRHPGEDGVEEYAEGVHVGHRRYEARASPRSASTGRTRRSPATGAWNPRPANGDG